jgi:fumarate reductase subunit D
VTTTVTLAAHGRLGAAFVNQPFGFLVFLAIPAFALWAVATHLRGGDLGERLRTAPLGRWIVGGLAVMLAAWVYRLVVTLG